VIGQGEGFVEVNGIRLHHLRWTDGGEERPAVVLVHATGFLGRLWQPVAQVLASRFAVHALDLRGHGDSDKPLDTTGEDPLAPEAESIAGDYHWQNFVDDLAGFMDALSLRETPIVGHSSGGAAAVYLAATRPEYVSRLVLFEPIIMPAGITMDEDQRSRMADGARKRRQVWGSTEEMVAAYRSRPTFEHWRDDVLRLYAEEGTYPREDGQIALKCPGEIEAQVFENSASLNIWDVLPRVDCPTLVMKGERTEGFLAAVATGTAGRMPNARLLTVPNAGHLAPMECPEAVAGEILAFLADG
jgi:pimeloyl-ACP methyl ester carboxylesterase